MEIFDLASGDPRRPRRRSRPSPHLEATGFWHEYDHPTEGRIRLPDVPTRFSETPGSIRLMPPRLGEHSVEVLKAAGMSDEEIEAMLDSGATKVPRSE